MKKQYLKPLSFFCIIFLFTIIWGIFEIKNSDKLSIENLQDRSIFVTGVLEGYLKSEMRKGAIYYQKINTTLTKLIETTELKSVVIKKNNTVIFDIGDNIPLMKKLPENKNYILTQNFFIFEKVAKLQDILLFRRTYINNDTNGLSWDFNIDLRNSKLTIVSAISLDEYHKTRKNEFFHLMVNFGIINLILILLVYFWIASIRKTAKILEVNKIKNRSDRLEELALTAAGIAHETKNPLGIIRGLAQQITTSPMNLDNIEMAASIVEEADVAADRLSSFVNFAKMRSANIEQLNAKLAIETVTNLLINDFNDLGIVLNTQLDDIAIYADKEMLNQILINLLFNSRDAIKEGEVNILLKKQNKKAELIVSDTGSGIPENLLNDILKPYVTGKENGHGIGLSLVKKFVDEMSWEIDIKSEINIGTTIKISEIKVVK